MIYILYLKAYCMYRRKFVEEPMMADTGIGRILMTKVIFPIQGYDRGATSLHEEVGHLGRERALNVGRGITKKGGDEQKSAQPTTIAVIEQWICLVLGLVCMGLWDVRDLYEARTGCSFCTHCLAGIAIYADVAGNGSRLHRIGRSAGTPGMGASLTAFRFPAA